MNSVKNAIVTMTLLAVSYGAYVVLNNPAPDSIEGISESDVWAAPEVSTTSLADATLETATDAATTALASLPNEASADATSADASWPPAAQEPNASRYGDAASAEAMSADAASAEATSANLGDENTNSLATDGTDAESNFAPNPDADQSAETNGNFYVAEAGGAATDDADADDSAQYPVTNAPDLPLGSPRGKTFDADTTTTAASSDQGDEFQSADNAQVSNDRLQDDNGFEATWQSAQTDLQSGQLGNALLSLTAWYGEPSLSTEQRERCLNQLDQLAGSVIYSRDSFLEPAHVVQQGETLVDIGRQYSVSPDFLARINGVTNPSQLRSGETIKIVRGPFRAEVDRNGGTLTLFLGRYYAGRFKSRVGEALPPGSGSYEVIAFDSGHTYFDTRTGNRVNSNDPANPYGSRWIGLRGNQITAAHNVGIHVDKNADSHTTCIAVSEVDADDLSVILTLNSRVDVKN